MFSLRGTVCVECFLPKGNYATFCHFLSYYKGWNMVCAYLLKEDRFPVVWGDESLELVRERGISAAGKTRGPDLANLLRTKNSWEEVLADDRLVNKCLSSYNSVRSTFEDLQDVKSKNSMPFFCKLWQFVKEQGGPFYSARDLRECNAVLYWLALNLCRPRHLRQKQLLILGLPGTPFLLLKQCLLGCREANLSQFHEAYFGLATFARYRLFLLFRGYRGYLSFLIVSVPFLLRTYLALVLIQAWRGKEKLFCTMKQRGPQATGSSYLWQRQSIGYTKTRRAFASAAPFVPWRAVIL